MKSVYIVKPATPRNKQLTIEDMLSSTEDIKPFYGQTSNTVTQFREPKTDDSLYFNFGTNTLVSTLQSFCEKYKDLYDVPRKELYTTFYEPKASGGMRRIDAPKEALSVALYDLKSIFENTFKALSHTTAFAYVKGRSTIDCVRRHQKGAYYGKENRHSRWFLKLDLSNFFGSTTLEFVMNKLSNIFPFSEVINHAEGKEALSRALELAFYNGGLPQGTPFSPTITNIMMIPIDFRLSHDLFDFDKHKFVYTRYADDFIISCHYDFNYKKVMSHINEVLADENAPFRLNQEKTKYGSNAGKNWILGVMLNKDNEMTIGYKNKKKFKATLANYAKDKQNGKPKWELGALQETIGKLSYYLAVEKNNIENIIKLSNDKFGFDIIKSMKDDIRMASCI